MRHAGFYIETNTILPNAGRCAAFIQPRYQSAHDNNHTSTFYNHTVSANVLFTLQGRVPVRLTEKTKPMLYVFVVAGSDLTGTAAGLEKSVDLALN